MQGIGEPRGEMACGRLLILPGFGRRLRAGRSLSIRDYLDEAYFRAGWVFPSCDARFGAGLHIPEICKEVDRERRGPAYIGRLNGYKNTVFFFQLEAAEWNNRHYSRRHCSGGDQAQQQDRRRHSHSGHGLLGETLLSLRLLDVLELAIHPVIVGKGNHSSRAPALE